MARVAVDPDNINSIYDERYEGDYMSGDRFTTWSHTGVELQRVRDTLSQIPAHHIGRVLDYGCGQGGWMDELAAAFPAAAITGIDISEKAIQKAGEKRPSYEFLQFNGVRAPFEDGTFDLVFSYHVLEHVLDIDRVVVDIARLVCQGGFVCVIFPCGNTGSLEARLVERMKGGTETGPTGSMRFFFEDPTHLRRMKSTEIIDLFGRLGADIRSDFYAHQSFGAIEWISKSGRAFVSELFDARRAVDLPARIKILVMGTAIRSLATLLDVSNVDLSRPRAAWKTAILHLLLPVRILGMGVSKGLDAIARLEWRYARLKKNGSAQFLVFQKQASAVEEAQPPTSRHQVALGNHSR